ncbi:MAG: DinB family protein [Flavobacteriaceae bacterium]|nr:DinB family protein [Flavobacteriaceae bacterium]
MNTQFTITNFNRKCILAIAKELSQEQLNTIPTGFKNNIIWNIGHTIVTQQLLVYKLSGLPCLISDETIANYGKGSTAKTNLTEKETTELLDNLLVLSATMEADYKAGKFNTYNNYTTSLGFELTDVEKAIQFSNYHEGIHLGIIMAIKKLV